MSDLVEVHSEAQISEVARLAREIWQEHYVPIIGQEQVDYMLDRFQSEGAIAAQISEGCEYYVVTSDREAVGYVAVVADESEASLAISKIYVKKSERGRGWGRKMLGFVENLCRRRRIRTIRLTVNKHNSRSIAWYRGMGFTNTGASVKEIGAGFIMDDFRMEKRLAGKLA